MRRPFVVIVCLLALGFAPFAALPVQPVAAERACFARETGFCAEGAFLAFWKTHGQTDILGFPITQPFVDDRGLIVQFFERAIMEWHPENEPQYQVLLTLLGAERLGAQPVRTEVGPPCPPDPASCAYFDATRHSLRGIFLQYWSAQGGLAVFGLPLTEAFQEINPTDGKSYLVQYFERNRFEYHPELEGTGYEVQLGLLGVESLRSQPDLLRRPPVRVPDYAVTAAVPARIAIPAIGVDAPVLPVGVDADGNMASPKGAFETTWYAPGPRPGQIGNAAIAGHVDYAGVGPAIFWRMRDLVPGDEVWIVGDDGSRKRFLVQGVESYLVSEAPLERIFGPTGDVNLNLVSCIGNFDPVSRSYDRRIVVYTRWDGVSR